MHPCDHVGEYTCTVCVRAARPAACTARARVHAGDAGAAHTPNDGRFKELLYGTENGRVGQLLLDPSMLRRGWAAPDSSTRDCRPRVLRLQTPCAEAADPVC